MGTVRAINQALGRVIRHAVDYGMVFLIDTRYCDNKMQKELPGWITQSMAVVDTLEAHFYNEIEEFYAGMRRKYRPEEGRK
jgi:Rad3-related DNA helicase